MAMVVKGLNQNSEKREVHKKDKGKEKEKKMKEKKKKK